MHAFTKYEVFTTSRLRANRRPMDGQIDKYLETRASWFLKRELFAEWTGDLSHFNMT